MGEVPRHVYELTQCSREADALIAFYKGCLDVILICWDCKSPLPNDSTSDVCPTCGAV